MSEKMTVCPEMYAYLDDKGKNYLVEIEMPGVEKKDIQLNMYETFLQITAERKDSTYLGHLHFPVKVDPRNARTTFRSGLLRVTVPLKEELPPPVKIEIK